MNKYYSIQKSKSNVKIPLIANVPHSSTFIPLDIRKSIVLNNFELEIELLMMTDSYVNELFSSVYKVGGILFEYNCSRLVLDPERFEDDEEENMAKKGMGVIYIKTSDGKKLRYTPTKKEKENLLNLFYRPYHRAFEQEAQNLLDHFKTCLIFDCHSFPSKSLPYENPKLIRPDICIGTSKFHTPSWLIEKVEGFFNDINWTIAFNEPFGGTYVPLKFLNKNQQVMSVMIEINRRLYMDEKTGEKLSSFSTIQNTIAKLVNSIPEVWDIDKL